MSLTDAQFITWLKSPARATCVLVEAVANVSGVETTRYLSSTGYVTKPTDTPANTSYTGVIVGAAKISSRLSLDGTGASLSVGDIELDNRSGELDAWRNDVWANRSLKMYVGDASWPRADFRLVFDGIMSDLAARARDVLNLKVLDKLQRLNAPVTETKLAGTSPNADRLKPLTFGEVHNIEPLLVDKATLKYQVHDGAMESVIEVRDNGVPVSHTDTVSAGTFVLTASPAGVVTASVQGDKPGGVYSKTVSKLVQRLATGYGKAPFVSGDLDATQLATFDAANTQPVGVYLAERENVLAICQQLAASVGAQVVMTEAGLLQLVKIALPATGTPTAVTATQMKERTLQMLARVPVQAAVQVGYCKNWTVQGNLRTGIPPEDADLFAQEWLTSTASDATTATLYKLMQQPVQQDSLLLVKTDADAEAARRLALWKTQRTVFRYEGEPDLMLEQLGGYQTLTHSRFGLSGGVSGQIVAVERDWLKTTVAFEVLT
jgi:hypothetical protein